MAAKKSKGKKDKPIFFANKDGHNVFLTKNGLTVICGIFLLLLSLYTVISLFSYLFTWHLDYSLVDNPDFMNQTVDVGNNGGKVGFVWAKFLITKMFGIGAFIVPFFFAALSIVCFKIKRINIIRLTLLSLTGCIIFSLLFSYISSFTSLDAWLGSGAGGAYGYYFNAWLTNLLGKFGAGCVVFLLLFTWLIFVNHKIAEKVSDWILRLYESMKRKTKEEPEEGPEGEEKPESESGHDEKDYGAFQGIEGLGEDEGELLPIEIIDTGEADRIDVKDADKASGEVDKGDDVELEIITPEDEAGFLKDLDPGSLDTLFDPRLDLPSYQVPSTDLLLDYKDQVYDVSQEELERNKHKIVRTLGDYKIAISKIGARIGPTVTLYEIVPAPGVRVAQIKRLEEDIALSLAAKGVRVVTLVGTNAIGIEVANERPSVVSMLSVLEDPKFKAAKYDLPIALGKTISNEVMSFDLAKMPHLLVAGATGQGKSVGLNAILTSLLYRKHPSELKLVLVDPKKVELSLYAKLEKHFLAKLPDADEAIITDTQKVVYTLKSLCQEMDARYDLLKAAHVRNIKEYNEKFLSRRLNPLKGHRFLPFIVVVIDEFADLLMTAGREVEEPIARLAQLARAIGIHLVIATQRPTTNIITGTIKANFPARIAFRVISSIDSKTILDQTGANQLIGRGDMLISTGSDLTRVQCAFIDTKEVEKVSDFIGMQKGYDTAFLLPEYEGEDGGASGPSDIDLQKRDKLFEEAARIIVQYQQGSTSLIQRKMNLGYNRAGRIIDQLEAAGIVGPYEGSKARQVLISDFRTLDELLESLN